MGHLKAELSSAGNIDKCLCSFKEKRGESHNKQGECAPCVGVCMRLHVKRKESEVDGERKRKRECRDRSKQGVCFWNPVWEVKPHLPRMPCLTPSSPLRFLGASLLLSSLCSTLCHLFISHLQLFSVSLETVICCEPALTVWSELWNLELRKILLIFQSQKLSVHFRHCEEKKRKLTEHFFVTGFLTGSEPIPCFPLSGIETSLFNSASGVATRCESVHTERMSCPLWSIKKAVKDSP